MISMNWDDFEVPDSEFDKELVKDVARSVQGLFDPSIKFLIAIEKLRRKDDCLTNTINGDFIGRDSELFQSIGRVSRVKEPKEDKEGNIASLDTDATFTLKRIGDQIERLRGRTTRFIPTREAVDRLIELRVFSSAMRYAQSLGMGIPFFSLIIRSAVLPFWELFEATKHGRLELKHGSLELKKSKETNFASRYLEVLNKIEAEIFNNESSYNLSKPLRELSLIADEVNISISRLNSTLNSFIHSASTSQESIESMISKIEHQDIKEEAKTRLAIVTQLKSKLDIEHLAKPGIDILSDEVQAAIGLIAEIEQHKIFVERLVESDRDKRSWTVIVVMAYMAILIALMADFYFKIGIRLQVGEQPLSKLKLPFFGIPWPVVLWSFIGSIAAMIYRFNRNPISDFGDAIKWLLTRPIQGVVLGSTFYLVIVSGLFLLTGRTSTDSAGLIKIDEVILVLSFLVGFSDRFADTVFNTLVDKYSKEDKRGTSDSDKSSDSDT